MGSTIAGLKAGVLGGVLYVGSLAIINVILLYAAKPEIVQYIVTNFQQVCPQTATIANSTTVADCFATIAPVYLPFIAFVAFFIALLYSAIFGRVYEHIPGRGSSKGVTIAVVTAITLIIFQLVGVTFNPQATTGLTLFLIASTFAYGFILGDLYRRYTRTVQFLSEDAKSLKIIVGRSDCTGRTKTFATRSTHSIRADTTEDGAFKEWVVSGGVTVEDARSFETSMEVNGDGMLKALVSRKY
jgi:hypothetical protein